MKKKKAVRFEVTAFPGKGTKKAVELEGLHGFLFSNQTISAVVRPLPLDFATTTSFVQKKGSVPSLQSV
jgi:hypothetical protein